VSEPVLVLYGILITDARGGNDPAIVLEDVDIDDVAPKVSHNEVFESGC
jgi:hypothetical protein